MTGTLVAKKLREAYPNERIVILESRELSSAATGRNAGHCKPDQWRGFAKYEKQFGAEQAKKVRLEIWVHRPGPKLIEASYDF